MNESNRAAYLTEARRDLVKRIAEIEARIEPSRAGGTGGT